MVKVFLAIDKNKYLESEFKRKIEDIKLITEDETGEECEVIISKGLSNSNFENFLEDAEKLIEANTVFFLNGYSRDYDSENRLYISILKRIVSLYKIDACELYVNSVIVKNYDDQMYSNKVLSLSTSDRNIAVKLLAYEPSNKYNQMHNYLIVIKNDAKDIELSDYVDSKYLKLLDVKKLGDLHYMKKDQLINTKGLGPMKYNEFIKQLLDINKTKGNSVLLVAYPFLKQLSPVLF